MFFIAIPWIASALTTTAAATAATTVTTTDVAEAFIAGTVVESAAAKGVNACKEK